jgi:glutaredoxin 3
MPAKVVIYGKDTCPYTRAARQDYEARGVEVTYHDVTRDAEAMRRFLELSGGERQVPLIVERDRVCAGFGGS